MQNFYEEYLKGNYQQVWGQLSNRDLTIASEAEIGEIESILNELFSRIKYNVEITLNILNDFGYKYENYGSLNEYNAQCIYANKTNEFQLIDFRKKNSDYGYFSWAFLEFYKTFTVLDFRGYFEDLDFDYLLDPLYIFPINVFIGLNETPGEIYVNNEVSHYLLFCPDEFIKENMSGDIGYGIYLRKTQVLDDNLFNYKVDLSFIDYLRHCFEWACFPNLKWISQDEIPRQLNEVVKKVRLEIKSF